MYSSYHDLVRQHQAELLAEADRERLARAARADGSKSARRAAAGLIALITAAMSSVAAVISRPASGKV